MDDAGVASPDPVKICVKITIKGDDLHVDFAGTQGQVSGPINLTKNGMLAAVFYSLKALIDLARRPTQAYIGRYSSRRTRHDLECQKSCCRRRAN
mgnify:CR=1 FL=1